MNYIKHLIECQCTLSIFKNKTQPVYHKIPVFSLMNEEGDLEEKYIICNNCGIVHRVYEACQSEIKWGQEDVKSLVTSIEDIKFNLIGQGHDRLVNIMEQNNLDVADWELLEYSIDNCIDCSIVLNRNESDNNVVLRLLQVSSDGKFKIKKEIIQRYL